MQVTFHRMVVFLLTCGGCWWSFIQNYYSNYADRDWAGRCLSEAVFGRSVQISKVAVRKNESPAAWLWVKSRRRAVV